MYVNQFNMHDFQVSNLMFLMHIKHLKAKKKNTELKKEVKNQKEKLKFLTSR